jgi:Flp pilus assembly protein TadD
MEQYGEALPYLTRAVALQPGSGIAHHRLGVILENLGRLEEAKAFYRRASDIGFKGADHEISRLESPGSGLLPPKKTTPTAR